MTIQWTLTGCINVHKGMTDRGSVNPNSRLQPPLYKAFSGGKNVKTMYWCKNHYINQVTYSLCITWRTIYFHRDHAAERWTFTFGTAHLSKGFSSGRLIAVVYSQFCCGCSTSRNNEIAKYENTLPVIVAEEWVNVSPSMAPTRNHNKRLLTFAATRFMAHYLLFQICPKVSTTRYIKRRSISYLFKLHTW